MSARGGRGTGNTSGAGGDKGKSKVPPTSSQRVPRKNARKGVVINENQGDDSYYSPYTSSPNEFEGYRRSQDEMNYDSPPFNFDQCQEDERLARQLQEEEEARARPTQHETIYNIDEDDDMDEQGDGGLGADQHEPERRPMNRGAIPELVNGKIPGPDVFKRGSRRGNSPEWMAKSQRGEHFAIFVIRVTRGEKNMVMEHEHAINKHAAKEKGGGANLQQTQLATAGGNSNLTLFKYNDIIAREVMAKFVATESLPFKFADSMRFQNTIRTGYQPLAMKISRTTMTRTIYKLSVRYKKCLRDMFAKFPFRVSICSDIWTCAFNQNSFLGITVHWIDDNWYLCKRILCFRKFNCAHTAPNIALCIIKVLKQFSLLTKNFSIGFDNASANTAAVPELIAHCNPALAGKYFHTRCICHVFNLCVQDGLKLLEQSITPIRKAITMLRDKTKLHRSWIKFIKSKRGRSKEFNVDVCTRWNSTYEMLRETDKEELCGFFGVETNHLLMETHWTSCDKVIELLGDFDTATKELSGVYYPTSPRVLYRLVVIALKFEECSYLDELEKTVGVMILKWLKYFTFIPDVFLVASILDPNLKLDGVISLLEFYYNALGEMRFAGGKGKDGLDLPSIDLIRGNLDASLRYLYNHFVDKYGGSFGGSEHSRRPRPSMDLGISSQSQRAQQLHSFFQNRGSSGLAQNDELSIYLNELVIASELTSAGPNNQDLLHWWSRRTAQYPILSIMARELFVVPASTVSVEQAFSSGGYTLDERRSTMTPQNLEAQVLLKDYTLAEHREQENKWDEVFEHDPISTTEAETDTDASEETDDFDDDFDFDNM